MNAEPPRALRIYPPSSPPTWLSSHEIHAGLSLPRPKPGAPPHVIVNAVSTLDGRATLRGRSTPLGGESDRVVMRNIRCAVDAVLVGAGTLRRENLDLGVSRDLAKRRSSLGLDAQPLQVIMKGRAPLPARRRLYASAAGRLLVLTGSVESDDPSELPADTPSLEASAEPDGVWPDPARAVRLLNSNFGVRTLLIEGGPAVNRSFLAAGLVHEVFLTLAPTVTGEQGAGNIVAGKGPPLPETPGGWRLTSAHLDETSNLFLRYDTRTT